MEIKVKYIYGFILMLGVFYLALYGWINTDIWTDNTKFWMACLSTAANVIFFIFMFAGIAIFIDKTKNKTIKINFKFKPFNKH